MSVWSAIGLADRKAVESLQETVDSLRRENEALHSEGKDTLTLLINGCTRLTTAKASEIHEDVIARMDGMSQLLCQQLEQAGEKTADEISSSAAKMQKDYSAQFKEVRASGKRLEGSIAKNHAETRETLRQMSLSIQDESSSLLSKQVETREACTFGFRECEQAIADSRGELRERIDGTAKQMADQQGKELERCKNEILGEQRDFFKEAEEYYSLTLETIEKVAGTYRQVGEEQRVSLDEIRALANEVVDVEKQQRSVLAKLSQLCQDADQFLEIQTSINNMWEIMKVVWVDSLLSDLKEGIDGAS